MRINLKRVASAAAVLAVVAGVAPFLTISAAHALGTSNGTLAMTPPSGNSGTAFALDPADPQVCPGDGATDGYRWQTFMAPASIDPATLTFDANGPIPQAGEFTQPLFDTGGSPVVQQNPDIGTAFISGIPQMNFAVFGPGVVPPGSYNIGIACTLGPPDADQLETFWALPITITTAATGGGPSQLTYGPAAAPAVPAAPVLNSLTPGDQTLAAAFTPTGTATPPVTGYTATATPTAGGTAVTANGATSPITIPGLTNGTQYDVTVHATNSVGNSAESNVLQGTPAVAPRAPVTNLTATPGTEQVTLSWTAPADGPTGYLVAVSPADAGPFTTSATTQLVTGLTPGTVYTFTVTPQHATPPTANPPPCRRHRSIARCCSRTSPSPVPRVPWC